MRLLLVIPLLALAARADDRSLMTIHRLEIETADRIQNRVLDPILGPGQSSVFVKLALEVKQDYEHSDRLGEGQATKVKIKNEISIATTTKAKDSENHPVFEGFGFADTTRPPYQETNGAKQTQESRQTKGVKEIRLAMSYRYMGLHLAILHDARIPPSKIASVRTALLAVYKWESGVDINFHPVEFSALK